jgi:hypothetical protein
MRVSKPIPGAHRASRAVGTRDSLPGDKMTGA